MAENPSRMEQPGVFMGWRGTGFGRSAGGRCWEQVRSILTYSGVVSNAGNVTLSNIIVLNNWPAAHTVVFTTPLLAPGAATNFTGSYVVPANCCVAWSTVVATGQDCYGATVTHTDTGTCIVLTSPRIVLTKVCGPGVLRPGDRLTYSGMVSNAGDIALMNLTVVNSQPGAGTIDRNGRPRRAAPAVRLQSE